MPTRRTQRPPIAKRDTGVCNFPGGYAWRARDYRVGIFVVCLVASPFLHLAVCDDFGQLQAVPCASLADGGSVRPLVPFAEGTH